MQKKDTMMILESYAFQVTIATSISYHIYIHLTHMSNDNMYMAICR